MLHDILLFAAGLGLGAWTQRDAMTRRVRSYAKRPYAKKLARTIVMEEWLETLKDPEMRPMLREMLDAAEQGDR